MAVLKYLDPTTGEYKKVGIPSEVKGMTMDLLWTNPNPTAEFAAQDITVAAGYDKFLVTNKLNVNSFSDMTGGTSGVMIYSYMNPGSSDILSMARVFSYQNNTFSFNNALFQGEVNNTYMIPLKIYGIKNTPVTYPEGGGTTESITYPGCFYRMINGVQEWLNPPMEVGVEYKTTERYMGKPVYVKLINFGAVPAANTVDANITHGIESIGSIVEVSGCMTSNETYPVSLPYSRETYGVKLDVRYDKIYVTTSSGDLSAYDTIRVWIKYTKTTD